MLAKYIAMILDNLHEKKRDQWCGGWDLNPRRPTPPGPQPGSPLARARVSQRGVIGARLGPITDNDAHKDMAVFLYNFLYNVVQILFVSYNGIVHNNKESVKNGLKEPGSHHIEHDY